MERKNKKLVSIVIPTYNSKDYLIEAINSCLKQTYKKIEILICDDGSTDETKSLIKTFLKKYPRKIRYFKLKHSGSPAIPRNIGMKAANGEYIAFLDSDDVMKKDRIKEQVSLIEKLNDTDIICTNASIIDENSKEKGSYTQNLEEELLSLEKLLQNNYIIQSTVLMKKSVLSKIGYNLEKETGYHEDYEYWLRASALKVNVYYFPKELIYYRLNPGGISRKMSTSQGLIKSIKTLEILSQNKDLSEDTKKMFSDQIKNNKKRILIENLKKYKEIYFFMRNISFSMLYPLIYLSKLLRFNIILKHRQKIKLHLGCGEKYLDGYINIDYPPFHTNIQTRYKKVDYYCDITKLKLNNNSVDEIRLHHVFEHFTYPESLSLLVRWNKALKLNGKLIIETPDIKACFKEFSLQKEFKKQAQILRHIFGSHEASWAIHKDGWYDEKYKFILNKIGFQIEKIEFTKHKSTRNITVIANKKESFSDEELKKRLKEILSLYLIDESEIKLLNEWVSMIKLK